MTSPSLISDSISELSNKLLNNFYSSKQKLYFPLLNLHFNFYLSTKYKLCFILVYRNCLSCQTIKTTFPIFLLGFSLAHLSKLTHYINRSTSQAIISILSELVTPEVLQPTPPKKNLILRFKARIRRGENVITFRKSEVTRKITRL